MSDRSQLEGLVNQLLDEAKVQGATAAEADVSLVTGLSTTVRLGEVETIEHNRDRGLAVTVYVGQRKGSASTSDFSASAVKEAVSAACGIARYTAEDGYAGLADPELMAYEYADLDLYHPWDLNAEHAIELGQTCEAAARDFDRRITNSEGASVSMHEGVRVYGNSHGFVGSYPTSRHSVSCSVIAQEGEAMQRDYWYSTTRSAEDLEGVESIGSHAAERAVRRLNGRRLATCQSAVVFAAEVASSLLSHLVGAIRGESLYRNASFLVDSLGQRLFPSIVNISEQPHLTKALGSAPFDAEGVLTSSRELVKDGVLQGYVLDSYSARKLGMQTTGNAGGVHNLIIEPGRKDLAEMLKEMDNGLLVTELMGQGVNKVTGDYSRGASGFWVEQGEIQYPVEEFTIAGNLRNMFLGVREIGRDVDLRRNVRTGSILIEEMTIAGA